MLAIFVSPQSKWYFNPHPLTRNLLTYFRGNVASTLLLLGYFCIFLRQSTTLHYNMKERNRDRDRECVRVWVCVGEKYQNAVLCNKLPKCKKVKQNTNWLYAGHEFSTQNKKRKCMLLELVTIYTTCTSCIYKGIRRFLFLIFSKQWVIVFLINILFLFFSHYKYIFIILTQFWKYIIINNNTTPIFYPYFHFTTQFIIYY